MTCFHQICRTICFCAMFNAINFTRPLRSLALPNFLLRRQWGARNPSISSLPTTPLRPGFITARFRRKQTTREVLNLQRSWRQTPSPKKTCFLSYFCLRSMFGKNQTCISIENSKTETNQFVLLLSTKTAIE